MELTYDEKAKKIKPPPSDATAEKNFGTGDWPWNNGYSAGHRQAVADARAVCREADNEILALEKQVEELEKIKSLWDRTDWADCYGKYFGDKNVTCQNCDYKKDCLEESEIGHCEKCSKLIVNRDDYFTEPDYPESMWHTDCKQALAEGKE